MDTFLGLPKYLHRVIDTKNLQFQIVAAILKLCFQLHQVCPLDHLKTAFLTMYINHFLHKWHVQNSS
jgi:hypothetical protein